MNIGASVARPRRGRARGYSRCRRSCTNGRPADPGRRFDDLANLVYDPAFLVVAWSRVRGNKGARTAGVDGVAPRSIVFGAGGLLGGLRDDLKAGRFAPQRVREKTIPKAVGQAPPPGDPDDRRPGRAGLVEAGARADLRGGLQAMLLWLPPEAPSPGRDRRDPLPRITHLGTTSGCSRRTSRRASTRSTTPPSWAGCDDRIGDKRVLGLGEGVPAGRDPHRRGPRPRDDHRHPARRDPLAAAGQHRPVRAGRALRTQVGSARPGLDARQAPPRRRRRPPARPLRLVADVPVPRPLRLLAGCRLDPQTPPRAELGNGSAAASSHTGRSQPAGPRSTGHAKSRSLATATGEPGSTHHGRTRHQPVESRMRGDVHVRFGGRAEETDRPKAPAPRLGPTPTPSTPRVRARSTAVSSSTRSRVGLSVGRSTRPK